VPSSRHSEAADPPQANNHEGRLAGRCVHTRRGQHRFVVRRPHRFAYVCSRCRAGSDRSSSHGLLSAPLRRPLTRPKALGHLLADRRHGPAANPSSRSGRPSRRLAAERKLTVGARPGRSPGGLVVAQERRTPGPAGTSARSPALSAKDTRPGEEPVHRESTIWGASPTCGRYGGKHRRRNKLAGWRQASLPWPARFGPRAGREINPRVQTAAQDSAS